MLTYGGIIHHTVKFYLKDSILPKYNKGRDPKIGFIIKPLYTVSRPWCSYPHLTGLLLKMMQIFHIYASHFFLVLIRSNKHQEYTTYICGHTVNAVPQYIPGTHKN